MDTDDAIISAKKDAELILDEVDITAFKKQLEEETHNINFETKSFSTFTLTWDEAIHIAESPGKLRWRFANPWATQITVNVKYCQVDSDGKINGDLPWPTNIYTENNGGEMERHYDLTPGVPNTVTVNLADIAPSTLYGRNLIGVYSAKGTDSFSDE